MRKESKVSIKSEQIVDLTCHKNDITHFYLIKKRNFFSNVLYLYLIKLMQIYA